MPVIKVKTEPEFQELIKKNEISLVDFSASWCGPCKTISPYFESLSDQNKEIQFIKVDVDELPEVSNSANIQAMPTFVVYKKGVITSDFIRGADRDGILKLISKYSKAKPQPEKNDNPVEQPFSKPFAPDSVSTSKKKRCTIL
jgi:thioredoxin 1